MQHALRAWCSFPSVFGVDTSINPQKITMIPYNLTSHCNKLFKNFSKLRHCHHEINLVLLNNNPENLIGTVRQLLHNITADFYLFIYFFFWWGVRHETGSSYKRCPQPKERTSCRKKCKQDKISKGNFINSAKLSKRCIFQYFLLGKITDPVFHENQLRLRQYRQ